MHGRVCHFTHPHCLFTVVKLEKVLHFAHVNPLDKYFKCLMSAEQTD